MTNKNKKYLFLPVLFFLCVFFAGIDKSQNIANAQCACEDGTWDCECLDDGSTYTEDEFYKDYEELSDKDFCESYPDSCYDDTEDGLSAYCDTAEGMSDPNCTDQFDYISDDPDSGEGAALDACNASADGVWDNELGTCRYGTEPSEEEKDAVLSAYCDTEEGIASTTCKDEFDYYDPDNAEGAALDACNKSENGTWDSVSRKCTYPVSESIIAAITKQAQAAIQTASQKMAAASAAIAGCGANPTCMARAGADLAAATREAAAANAAFDAQIAAANAGNYNPNTGSIGGTALGGTGNYNPNIGSTGGTALGGTGNYGNVDPSGLGGVSSPKCGADFSDIGGVCFPNNTNLSSASIPSILSNILSWLMGLFTLLAVAAFVISGIQYLMASGSEDLAESAKKNAVNAIIGIIVGLSGFIIIKAIATALSGQGYTF